MAILRITHAGRIGAEPGLAASTSATLAVDSRDAKHQVRVKMSRSSLQPSLLLFAVETPTTGVICRQPAEVLAILSPPT